MDQIILTLNRGHEMIALVRGGDIESTILALFVTGVTCDQEGNIDPIYKPTWFVADHLKHDNVETQYTTWKLVLVVERVI